MAVTVASTPKKIGCGCESSLSLVAMSVLRFTLSHFRALRSVSQHPRGSCRKSGPSTCGQARDRCRCGPHRFSQGLVSYRSGSNPVWIWSDCARRALLALDSLCVGACPRRPAFGAMITFHAAATLILTNHRCMAMSMAVSCKLVTFSWV